MKTAVVLLNLGGPDNYDAVRPFLFNLFSDRAIIGLPQPFRWLLAKLISSRRTAKAKGIYSQMGGGSTIMPETSSQADALQKALGPGFKVFICMRYWHPMAEEVVQQVATYNPDKIILLPLYPQFSTTTTASSFKDWQTTAEKLGLHKPTIKPCCYYANSNFTKAYTELTLEHYSKACRHGKPRVLFCAHGIPQNRVEKGDPYEWQIQQSVESVVEMMGIDGLDYSICYQSRVGPLKWLQPSAEEELERAAHDNIPIVLVPISFVSEHSETLVELDIQYKQFVEALGCRHYYRVPAVRVNDNYIKCLKEICLDDKIYSCKNTLDDCKKHGTRGRT